MDLIGIKVRNQVPPESFLFQRDWLLGGTAADSTKQHSEPRNDARMVLLVASSPVTLQRNSVTTRPQWTGGSVWNCYYSHLPPSYSSVLLTIVQPTLVYGILLGEVKLFLDSAMVVVAIFLSMVQTRQFAYVKSRRTYRTCIRFQHHGRSNPDLSYKQRPEQYVTGK